MGKIGQRVLPGGSVALSPEVSGGANQLDRLLIGIVRVAAMMSCAAAAFGLVMALIEPWPGSPVRRWITGVLVLAGNLAIYRWRGRLYTVQRQRGMLAVWISLAAGALLFLDGARDTPFLEGLWVGVGLAAISGQIGWSLCATATLAGCYLGDLALHGDAVIGHIVAVNVLGAFILAAGLGSVQWWFARFVNVPSGDRAPVPLADARQLIARDAGKALSAGRRNRKRLALLPGRPEHGVCTLSAAERVGRLSDLQREIYRLQAAGLRKSQIAKRVHVSASTLYRERQAARQAAHARTDEQLIGMLVHVERLACLESEEQSSPVGELAVG